MKFFVSKSGHLVIIEIKKAFFKLSYLIFMVFEDISKRKEPNVQYKTFKGNPTIFIF